MWKGRFFFVNCMTFILQTVEVPGGSEVLRCDSYGLRSCPTAGGEPGDYLGQTACAICGKYRKIAENVASCHFVFTQFSVTTITQGRNNVVWKCKVTSDYCKTAAKACFPNFNTLRCENIYLTSHCCVCKKGFAGSLCLGSSISELPYRPSIKLDLRHRSNCWAHIVDHNTALTYASEKRLSRIIVSRGDSVKNSPLWVNLFTTLFESYFTKYNIKLKKKEAVTWCLTHTNLRVYCQRLETFFLPTFNEGVGFVEREIIVSESELYYSIEGNQGVRNIQNLFWDKNNELEGAIQILFTFVFPFLPEPPFLRFYEWSGVQITKPDYYFSKYLKLYQGEDYNLLNYTEVDVKCFPDIRNQCFHEYKRSEIFTYMTVSFKMQYHRPPNGCEETSYAHWQLFKFMLNVDYVPGQEWMTREGCCSIDFPPYSFEIGVYHIKYTMMHIQNGRNVYMTRGCIQSFYHDTVKAKFDEYLRVVNVEDTTRVEVKAFDINYPPKEQTIYLIYQWSCTLNDTTAPCTELERFYRNAPSFDIPPYTLAVNTTYKISVTVNSTKHNYLHWQGYPTHAHVIQNLKVGSREFYKITLVCATCDHSLRVNSEEYNFIVIRAIDGVSEPKPAAYEWKYSVEDKGRLGEFQSVDDIREDTGSIITLKIKKNGLNCNKTYVIQARDPNREFVFAQIRIATEFFNIGTLNCTLNPMTGVRGWTDFNVFCEVEEDILHFEFYDKDENDERIFGGRMLGYNSVGILNNFKMTRGKLIVLAYNNHLARKNYTSVLPLKPFNDTLRYLEWQLAHARDFIDSNQFDYPSSIVSSVAEVTEIKMEPSAETIKQPVVILNRVHCNYILGRIKMVLSSLKVILENTVRKFDILAVDAYLTSLAARSLYVVTIKLKYHMENKALHSTLTRMAFYDMIKVVFDCAEMLLEQKNRGYRSRLEIYVIPAIRDLVQTTSLAVVSAFELISYCLNIKQNTGDTVIKIASDRKTVLAITKTDFAFNLVSWTISTNEENCSVLLSDDLLLSMGYAETSKQSNLLGLQYIRMTTNPFWWAGGNIVSEVISANIFESTKSIGVRKLTHFKRFIALRLKVIQPLKQLVYTEGSVYQIDPKTTDDVKELQLTVYTFFLPERAKFFVKFFINDTEEYRITITEGLRPEYDTVVRESNNINAKSPEYKVPYDNKYPNEKTYYMVILPSENVRIGERVAFRFKAYYALCNNWVKWQWTSTGCWVGAETSQETIHCDCDHLSVIAGTITTPDYHLCTVSDILLYLTPWENLLPLLITLEIVLLYFLILIWVTWKDRMDQRGGEVILLRDNFPNEPYAYLVGVHTGSRLFSGTTAIVGIRLIGFDYASRSHILRSPDRSVLNTFSDDWFFIYSQIYLGKLESLWLWHNDEGCSPEWFVERVEVYDLQTKDQYVFTLNTWIAMDYDVSPDVCVSAISIDEYFSTMNLLRFHLMNCVRDTNIWTSVCLKHPRSPVPRVARLTVTLCFVLTAMAMCLFLYLFHFGFLIDEDKPSYYLNSIDLFILCFSLITASIAASLMMGLFRKSYTHDYRLLISSGTIAKSVFSSKINLPERLKNINEREVHRGSWWRTVSEKFTVTLQRVSLVPYLLPVQLPGSKSELMVRENWLKLAYILCICTACTSLLFILMYAWKLPTIKNFKFVSTFFGAVVIDAFLLSTLKVLVFSVLLCVFQNVLPVTTYRVKIKDGRRCHLYGNIHFLAKLIKMRNQSIYYPMRELIKESKRLRKIRIFRWQMFLEFVLTVGLVCVISAVCNIYYLDRFTSNSHAVRMMTNGESPNLSQVFNRTDLYDFLEITFVGQLFRYIWYNYKPLSDLDSNRKDWTDDCVSRLIGNTQIRQLRVSKNRCNVSGYWNNSIKSCCAPPWSGESEDRAVYATSWGKAHPHDATRKKSSWRYTWPANSNSSRFYGRSGTLYHRGGYITELGYSEKEIRSTLLTLENEAWLDHMTRAVFVEMTLYNVNTDLFTQLVVVCEQQPTGQYISIPRVESVTINANFNFWIIGFIVFQVFYLLRALFMINRRGVSVYFSNSLDSYGIFLLVVGFASVVFYVIHFQTSSEYVEEYRRRGMYHFFSFFEIVRFDFMGKVMMCLLFGCTIVKLLLSWNFGRIYFSFYYTFSLSWSMMFWLTLYFSVYQVILWGYVGYKLNVFIFSHYSYQFTDRVQTNDLYPKDLKTRSFYVNGNRFAVYLMSILNSFARLLLVLSFIGFYRMAKLLPFSYREVQNFNFLNFLKNESKILTRRGK